MTDTDTKTLTLTDAGRLADLIRACERNARIRYYPRGTDDADHPMTGVLRCFAHEGGGLWFDADGDIRDAYVHISGTFEHWFKVSDLMAALGNAVDARQGWDKPMLMIDTEGN